MTLAPWSKTTYNQPIPDKTVCWSRPGHIWTKADVKELSKNIGKEWTAEFGELEEVISSKETGRLRVITTVEEIITGSKTPETP